tara:strand:- start:239 stop:526 length:288 start_codon:yes stop_codon:yes gene_type:complete
VKEINDEKLDKYFSISRDALEKAKAASENLNIEGARADFLDMIERYLSDAQHFRDGEDYVNAFAAVSYAHGWLDAGARIGLWSVKDSRLFTVDDE